MAKRNSRLTGPTRPYGLVGALKSGIGGKSTVAARLRPAGSMHGAAAGGAVSVAVPHLSPAVW